MQSIGCNAEPLVCLEGLQLLLKCKVPNFGQQQPDDRARLFQCWSEDFLRNLYRLVEFMEQNRKTLFYEQCCPITSEFKKYFVLVYFEQISLSFEYAWFQVNNEIDDVFEYRLSKFGVIVDNILTKDSNISIQCWLFHYYGRVLGMEGWEEKEGEVYSFIRLFHFLAEHDRMTIQFCPKILAFVENFGKKLLTCRKVQRYQELGLILLHTLMKHTCNKPQYFIHDEDSILQLVLPLVWKDAYSNNECMSSENLWNVVYYSLRSMRVPNHSLDDQIMRMLLALLNENESNIDQSHIYIVTLTRLLLINLPEVAIIEDEITIFGKRFTPKDFRLYIKRRIQGDQKLRKCRYPFNWRYRILQILPKLITRFAIADNSYFARYYLEQLMLLMWVIIIPIELTGSRQRAQAKMLSCLLREIEKTARGLWVSLEHTPSQDLEKLQDWLLQHNNLVALTSTITDAFLELIPYLQRSSKHTQCIIRNAVLQVMETDNILETLNRTLERSIDAVGNTDRVEIIFRGG